MSRMPRKRRTTRVREREEPVDNSEAVRAEQRAVDRFVAAVKATRRALRSGLGVLAPQLVRDERVLTVLLVALGAEEPPTHAALAKSLCMKQWEVRAHVAHLVTTQWLRVARTERVTRVECPLLTAWTSRLAEFDASLDELAKPVRFLCQRVRRGRVCVRNQRESLEEVWALAQRMRCLCGQPLEPLRSPEQQQARLAVRDRLYLEVTPTLAAHRAAIAEAMEAEQVARAALPPGASAWRQLTADSAPALPTAVVVDEWAIDEQELKRDLKRALKVVARERAAEEEQRRRDEALEAQFAALPAYVPKGPHVHEWGPSVQRDATHWVEGCTTCGMVHVYERL